MNKYHKRKSELGRTLPGWVKVGALAVGVGVGVGGWSPGGGVGKVCAGKTVYVMKVEEIAYSSGSIRTIVSLRDVAEGFCDRFAYTTESNKSVVFRGGSLSGLLEKFFAHGYLVSFSVGGTDVSFDEQARSLSLHSTNEDVSWFVKLRGRDIKLSGVFKNCVCETDQKLLVEQSVSCGAAVLLVPYARVEKHASLTSEVLVCLNSFLKNYGQIGCVFLTCLGTVSCDNSKCTLTVRKHDKPRCSVLRPASPFDDNCVPWKLNDGSFVLPFEGDSHICAAESDGGRFLQFPECGYYMCFVMLDGFRKPSCDATISAKSVDGRLLKDGSCFLDCESAWVSLINLQIKAGEDRKIRFVLKNFPEANIDKLNCERFMLFIFPL